jgi:DNA-directed RNA polymerase specialized sigma24 family protein
MDEREWLAERFEEHRTRLRAVAYRMLGSLSEADDAVQEVWLRLSRTDTTEFERDPRGRPGLTPPLPRLVSVR